MSTEPVKFEMGQRVLQVPSSLIGLSEELRVELLRSYLNFQDRQTLRQTCSTLCYDIDEYLGPSECLHLNDGKSNQVYEFYGRTYFSKIEISESCLFDGLRNMIYKPQCVISMTLNKPDGIVSSTFLVELLEKAKGLKTLHLNGVIQGEISGNRVPIILPRLKKLQLMISDEVYKTNFKVIESIIDIIKRLVFNPKPKDRVETALKMWWESQLALLTRLTAPNCKEITLALTVRPNYKENFDELELVQKILDLFARHPNCQRLKIKTRLFGTTWPTSIRLPRISKCSFYYQRMQAYGTMERVKRSSIGLKVMNTLKTTKMDIRELTYVSEIEGSALIDIYLCFFIVMSFLKGLEKLNVCFTTQIITWEYFEKLILQNQDSLTELVISGTLDFDVDPEVEYDMFEIFSFTPMLKTLWIDTVCDVFWMDLTISTSTIDNLTTLILLGEYGVEAEYLEAIPQLVYLKYLSLTGVWSNIPLGALKGILYMRSLEGVIIPMDTITHPLPTEEMDEEGDDTIRRALDEFVSKKSKVFYYELRISDRNNPWWTVMADETVEYYEPGRNSKE